MRYRDFGTTGLRVSEIGIGAYPISGLQRRPDGTAYGWSGTDDAASVAMIHRAEDLGVNVIDSAEGYGAGHSETLVGTALRGRRGRWIVATKVQPNQGLERERPDTAAARRRVLEACEQSLRRPAAARVPRVGAPEGRDRARGVGADLSRGAPPAPAMFPARAAVLFHAALPLHRHNSNVRGIAAALANLGHVSLWRADAGQAEGLFRQSLAGYRALGRPRGVAVCLVGLAGVAAARGEAHRAARLLGGWDAQHERLGAHLEACDRALYGRQDGDAPRATRRRRVNAALAQGRALTLDAALELALRARPARRAGKPAVAEPRQGRLGTRT